MVVVDSVWLNISLNASHTRRGKYFTFVSGDGGGDLILNIVLNVKWLQVTYVSYLHLHKFFMLYDLFSTNQEERYLSVFHLLFIIIVVSFHKKQHLQAVNCLNGIVNLELKSCYNWSEYAISFLMKILLNISFPPPLI